MPWLFEGIWYAWNMNKNLTIQNVGILFELRFNPIGVQLGDLPDQFMRDETVLVRFFANDHIQISTVGNPSSRIVDTFAAALEILEELGIK